VAKQHKETTKLLQVGTSEEGRQILGIQFGVNPANPYVVIDSGIHAREWTAIHVAYFLVEQYSNGLSEGDLQVRALVDAFNIVIIPVLNPDGFSFTWDADEQPFKHRLWRKNRSPKRCTAEGRCCEGVDLNRNWDLAFSASQDPCSDVYAGPSPFSASETRTYSRWLRTLPALEAYITLHSHGQLWLYPYAYAQNTYTRNVERTIYVAQKAIDAIYAYNGTRYGHATPADALYTSTGSSMDWVERELEPEFAYTIEVRPVTQEYGFILEKDLLLPASKEIAIGINVVLTEAMGFRQTPFRFTGSTPKPQKHILEQRDPPVDEPLDENWMKWLNDN
ncbi:unnamed protein product, partial [Mesorhabditis spiculigera]